MDKKVVNYYFVEFVTEPHLGISHVNVIADGFDISVSKAKQILKQRNNGKELEYFQVFKVEPRFVVLWE